MKANETSFRRLLAAAAKAPREAIGAPPIGLETRVLANLRAEQAEEEPAFLFVFLRRAMAGAALILLLSAAWGFTQPNPSVAGDEAAALDYQIQMSLNP